ncbi:hypothetical protein EV360DRAFT_80700 [Lentinula raphanica]|nr:hypothetical protein EV360DRAFT_80700 [Lentinula raphanica]
MARFALQLVAITFIGIATIEIVYLPTLAAPISAFSEPPVPSSDSLLGQGSQTIGGTQRLALEAVELGVPTLDLDDKEPNPVDDDDLFTFDLDGVDNRADRVHNDFRLMSISPYGPQTDRHTMLGRRHASVYQRLGATDILKHLRIHSITMDASDLKTEAGALHKEFASQVALFAKELAKHTDLALRFQKSFRAELLMSRAVRLLHDATMTHPHLVTSQKYRAEYAQFSVLFQKLRFLIINRSHPKLDLSTTFSSFDSAEIVV